jgi:hypothetical protein
LFFHEPDPPLENYILAETTTKHQEVKTKKQTNMKPVNRYIKWGVTLLLVVFANCAMAQSGGPYPLTGNDNVCIGQTKSYGVTENPGSTYSWTITPGAAGNRLGAYTHQCQWKHNNSAVVDSGNLYVVGN